MNEEDIEKFVSTIGYRNAMEFLIKFLLPGFNISLILGIAFMFIVRSLNPLWGVVLMFVGFLITIGYPVFKYEARKKDIQGHLHLFITYAGTIATMKISRLILFQRVAEKKVFGSISELFEKVLYIAKSWTLGYSTACRRVAKSCPSKIMNDFLDRLAVTMDFGEDLEVFLFEEQKAVLDDYAVEYNKSLETIKMLQEVFISFSISSSFIIGIILLAPLMMDFPLEKLVLYLTIGVVFLDVILVYLVDLFVPSDHLFSRGIEKNDAQKRVFRVFYITLAAFPFLFGAVWAFTTVNFIFVFAIAATPFLIPGFMATAEEENVLNRDKNYHVYARVLGSAIEIRDGGVVSALRETQVHDFGVLNPMSVGLYRRLKVGGDKYKAWHLFGVESGSNLIYHFTRIFSQSVYLGGDARRIGQIISKNIQSLLALRKLRLQLKDGLRGAFYGSLIGFCGTMFVTLTISEVMVDAFTSQAGQSTEMFSFVSSIVPQTTVNFEAAMFGLGVLVVLHAAITSLIPKLIDGGSYIAAFKDFVFMLWISAVLYWILPIGVRTMLPAIG
jgi:archaeal flagellar protein FlaJ